MSSEHDKIVSVLRKTYEISFVWGRALPLKGFQLTIELAMTSLYDCTRTGDRCVYRLVFLLNSFVYYVYEMIQSKQKKPCNGQSSN